MPTPSHRARHKDTIDPNPEASPVKLEQLLRYVFGRLGYLLSTADDDGAQ